MIKETCIISGQEFSLSDEDLSFYQNLGVPAPTLCPEERQRRRLAFQNDRHLFHRTCDATGENILSNIPKEAPFKVYEKKYWWSDKWDPFQYGGDIDFMMSFFPQIAELEKKVPKMNLLIDSNENSDYVHHCGWNKNCYLCFCADHNEDCYFCQDVYSCKDVVDSLLTYESELCYEMVNCQQCYQCMFLQNCNQCSDCHFCKDCIGCANCFGCTNLRNKEYYFLNQRCSKEEYEEKFTNLRIHQQSGIAKLAQQFQSFSEQFGYKCYNGVGNEDCSGDMLNFSKNSHLCFESRELEDCKFCCNMRGAKDCYDINRWGHYAELCYECLGVGENAYNMLFCSKCWDGSNLLYCIECIHCKDCFGCVGLKNKQYCIFNKQYKKDEYETLLKKVIQYMKGTGEWGEFFPVSISPFGYNLTVANEYFPLTKDEAIKKGFLWSEEPEEKRGKNSKLHDFIIDGEIEGELQDSIYNQDESILSETLYCEQTGKPYKIQKPEFEFYKNMGIPIPRIHPEIRHQRRASLKNPRTIWTRTCGKCGQDIETSFAPERPEKVLCETCYENEVV